MRRLVLRGWQKALHWFLFVGLLFSSLGASRLQAALASSSPPQGAPQQATITLDGVGLSIAASSLPSRNFAVAEPGSASQVATSASWRPFREFTVTAVPFGNKAGTEALPVGAAGSAEIYKSALRSYREQQGAEVSDGSAASLFGQQVTALHSLVQINIDGPALKPVAIDEWVVEAGNRVWLVRSSAEQLPGILGAQGGIQGLSMTSPSLDQPSTLSEAAPEIGAANSAPGLEAAALPTPPWWHGDCDTITYAAGAGGRAAYRLGEVYQGMPACGPRPWSDGAPDVLVRFFPGAWGVYEWECVELAMRFLYLKYVISPYHANGSQVVWNYSGTRLVKISNGTAGRAPKPDDVLSYGATSTSGHTAVVTSSGVDASGNGTVTVVEENSAVSGRNTLTVSNWTVSAYSGSISGWLHDATTDPTPTPTSTPTPAVTPMPTYVPTPGPGSGPAFSDDFNRPDGAAENGWLAWANGDHDPSAGLLGGELQTYGYPQVAGGTARNLLVTFPITFAFDFRSDNASNGCGLSGYNDAGWRITFNSADSPTPNTAVAQLKLEQYGGSLNLIRRYLTSAGTADQSGMAQDAAALAAGQRDFGPGPAHIEGKVLADLSTEITIHYNDGLTPDPVVIRLGPAAGAVDFQPGPMLMLANSNCSSGPHYFDDLQVGAYTSFTISGNARVPGARLSYFDIVPRTATADSNGLYSFQVPAGWSGTVTPSATGATFTPASRNYTGVMADQAGQDYQAVVTRTFASVGSEDGWTLESSETSEQGATLNGTASTFRVGDGNANEQYRSILSFNTSTLPDNAIVTQATLQFKKQGRIGTNPFQTMGNLLADIRKGGFSSNVALQIGDFQAAASRGAALTFTNSLVNGWYSKVLGSADLGYIYKTGRTQFRLRFATGDNNDLGEDYLSCFSGNAGSADRPKLIVQYTFP